MRRVKYFFIAELPRGKFMVSGNSEGLHRAGDQRLSLSTNSSEMMAMIP